MFEGLGPIDAILKSLAESGLPIGGVEAASLRKIFDTMFANPKHLEEISAKCKEFVEEFFSARRAAIAAGLDPASEVGGLSPMIVMADSISEDMAYKYEYLPIEEAFQKIDSFLDHIPKDYSGPMESKFGAGVVGSSSTDSMKAIGRYLVQDLNKVPFLIGLVATIVPSPGFSALVVTMPDGSVGPVPPSSTGYIVVGVSRPNIDPRGPKYDFASSIAAINDDDTVSWFKFHPDGAPYPPVSDIMDGVAEATAAQLASKLAGIAKAATDGLGLIGGHPDHVDPDTLPAIHVAVAPNKSDMGSYHTMLKKLQETDISGGEVASSDQDTKPAPSPEPKPKHHKRF